MNKSKAHASPIVLHVGPFYSNLNMMEDHMAMLSSVDMLKDFTSTLTVPPNLRQFACLICLADVLTSYMFPRAYLAACFTD